MVLLLFNIAASAGRLLGKLAFVSGGKDGAGICRGDVSEEPGRRTRSELLPAIGLWEGSKDFVRAVCFQVCCTEGHGVRPSHKSWVLVSLARG